ncbi:hypothetical protein HN011_005971 [Eciton burchellii]|nr:hypothetical protein HN011_005971 [Eciton burchellii]
MKATIAKAAITRPLLLLLLLFLYDHATGLIIPEELPTILSLVYSNIPPIKKGTDSRLGVGFRLGEHADFQVVVELGPQTETDPIGISGDAKRRRDTMLSAAMRGELGPLAQAVARYQIERRIHNEMAKLKAIRGDELEKDIQTPKETNKGDQGGGQEENASSDWLTKWKEQMSAENDNVPSRSTSEDEEARRQRKGARERIKPIGKQTERLNGLMKLYESQRDEANNDAKRNST